MIDIKTKIHDAFSIEFKVGFKPREDARDNNFNVGMWIFLPGSLDITPSTYSKTDFYRDVKSNIRLVTPSWRLDGIASGEPAENVRLASPDDYEYQLKMFSAIVKSSLRDSADIPDDLYCRSIRDIFSAFWSFRKCDARELCGEFLCNIVVQSAFRRIERGGDKKMLSALILEVDAMRKERGFLTVLADEPEQNKDYIYRQSVLKKYVERPFYLRAPKKRDGLVAEQAYYSVAAGLAMLFATVVAWAFQRKFGNLTWPLFIALIISYMMKDRIKELMRYYFAHRVGSKYYDNKAKIIFKDKRIGALKEGMDFISYSKVPEKILYLRNFNRQFDGDLRVPDEKVILYRKAVTVDRDINDIIRLQVGSFLHKMDNPVKDVYRLDDDGNIVEIPCKKDYHINIVLQYEQGKETDYKHFRISLTRDGIQSIEEII